MKNVPQYLFIESELRKKILAGTLKTGDQLPVEQELAAEYGVSRTTLRRALRILEADGLLFPITSKGTFVTDPEDREQLKLKRRQVEFRRRSKTIAALVPSITLVHYPPIVRGIEDECTRSGYQLALGNFDGNLEKETAYLLDFMDSGVRGIIVSPHYRSHENEQYKAVLARGIPLVLTDTGIDGIEADLVATDNEKGASEGTRTLIDAGCKRIAFLSGWLSASSSRDRLRGFETAMREAGLPVREELVLEGHFAARFGREAWNEKLAAAQPDGIFSANDPITTGLLHAIVESGNTPPEKLRIATFDRPDIPFEFHHPLTLVEQPAADLGAVACGLLIRRIEALDAPPPEMEAGFEPEPSGAHQKILLSPSIRQLTPTVRPRPPVQH